MSMAARGMECDLSERYSTSYFLSMCKRLNAVKDAKGWYTKYWYYNDLTLNQCYFLFDLDVKTLCYDHFKSFKVFLFMCLLFLRIAIIFSSDCVQYLKLSKSCMSFYETNLWWLVITASFKQEKSGKSYLYLSSSIDNIYIFLCWTFL